MINTVITPMVRSTYDLQKLRISLGNRVVAAIRTEMGQVPGTKEDTIDDAEALKVLDQARASYQRITDGLVHLPREKTFSGDSVISTYGLLVMVDQYVQFLAREKSSFRQLEKVLKSSPIYEWLINVKGVGTAMAGVLISEIDISVARYPSSLWALAGLDVGPDGQGRSKRKAHLVKRSYVDREGKTQARDSITFNPFLKSKLMGVLADSFIRVGNERYRKTYDNYKHRLETNPRHAEKTKGHRHMMAKRYMVKMFLVDLHIAWRSQLGLPVSTTYDEGVLGHRHGEGCGRGTP